MTSDLRYKYSAKHIRRMKLFERQHLKAIFKALEIQIKPVVTVLRSEGPEAAMNSLDTVQINSHLAAPIRDIYTTVGLYFANKTIYDIRQAIKEVKAGFGFNEEFIRDILSYFNQFLLNQAVLPISDTTKNQILQILTQGIRNGWGVDRIAELLESPELMLWRARLIVRTESNKAMNYGQLLGESKSELESDKIWIAANDHRTRHSHRVVDDVQIPFKERFMVPVYKSVGGVRGKTKGIEIQVGVDMMSGPGDVHASAGNVCNCRCTLAFKARRDENGRLIRKVNPIFVKSIEEEMTKDQITELFAEAKSDFNQTAVSTRNEIILHREKILSRIESLEKKYEDNQTGGSDLVTLIKSKNEKSEENIDALIDLINSKEYNPEIKLKTDSPEVIRAINEMRAELIVFLRSLKKELSAKKKVVSTVERDKNDLIKTITSEII